MLTAHRAAAGTVDRQPGHVHHGELGVEQHRFQERGDAAEQVQPDPCRAVLGLDRADRLDQLSDARWSVGHRMTGKHLPRVRGLDLDRVDLLRNVNTDGYRHARSSFHELRRAAPPRCPCPT